MDFADLTPSPQPLSPEFRGEGLKTQLGFTPLPEIREGWGWGQISGLSTVNCEL